MNADNDKILKQYLGGVFHFDIESPESALNEYLDLESREWLEIVKVSCDRFLNKEMPVHEKTKFIETYFNYDTSMEPLEWLEYVIVKIEEKLNFYNQ